MKYSIIYLILALLFDACVKEECQIAGGLYVFEIPATLVPAEDTFAIGDTITITSSFCDEVFERKTGKKYKLKNLKFYPGTYIYKIDTNNVGNDGLKFFNIILDTIYNYNLYQYSSGSIGLFGQYNYFNNIYKLEYKLIPSVKGSFLLNQGSSLLLDKNQTFEGKCSNINIDGFVKLNEGAENNIHMLLDSPDPHYRDWIMQKPEERFHKFGGYCFYVKE